MTSSKTAVPHKARSAPTDATALVELSTRMAARGDDLLARHA